MYRVERDVHILRSQGEIFAFHDNPSNIAKVLPAYLRVEILQAPERLHAGAQLWYRMYLGPLRFEWKLEITEHEAPFRFVDVQRAGPFQTYRHTHGFAPEGAGTRMSSLIEYEPPPGALSELAHRVVLHDRLAEALEQVHQTTKVLLERREQ